MLECKYSGKLQERRQDSAEYVNQRFNLRNSEAVAVVYARAILEAPVVKRAAAPRPARWSSNSKPRIAMAFV
jgi:hypothetical protein